MSNDIPTRLRNIYTFGQLGVVHEAADEIERLRKEVNRLHREMDMELFGESEYEEDE